MSLDTADQDLMWPMDVEYSLVDNSSTKAIIQVGPGITTMVGPNGSGKTRALRAIKSKLLSENRIIGQNRKSTFSFGRTV